MLKNPAEEVAEGTRFLKIFGQSSAQNCQELFSVHGTGVSHSKNTLWLHVDHPVQC